MTQFQGDIIIIQTLDDITLQSSGIWHQLCHNLNLCTLQRHASCHNQTDIAGAEDYYLLSRHPAFHIHISLGGSRGIHARRTVTRNIKRPSGTLPTAHSKDNCLCLNLEHPLLLIHYSNYFILRNIYNNGMEHVRDFKLLHLLNISSRIFRPRQFLLKGM